MPVQRSPQRTRSTSPSQPASDSDTNTTNATPSQPPLEEHAAAQSAREIRTTESELSREVDRKLLLMQNEFSRQMHAMHAMIAENNASLQNKVSAMQNFITNATATPPNQSQQERQIAGSTDAIQSIATRSQTTSQQPPSQSLSLQNLSQTVLSLSAPQMSAQPLHSQHLLPSSTYYAAHLRSDMSQPPSQSLHLQNLSQTVSSLSAPQMSAQPLPPQHSLTNNSRNSDYLRPDTSLPQYMWTTQRPQSSQQLSIGLPPTPLSVVSRNKKVYPLPIFTGCPEEWPTFLEAFQTTTIEFEYSNLHNIMRLRDALKGKARNLVESLLSSSANVEDIIKALAETFGRPELLIKSQIEKARSTPPLIDGNLTTIAEFANVVQNMATFLKNAGGWNHLSNPTLLSELVVKLPPSKQMQWAERCNELGRIASIMDFSEWLGNLRKLVYMVSDSLPDNTQGYKPSMNRHKPQKGSRYVYTSISTKRCIVCENSCNNLAECKIFTKSSVPERWSMVKQFKLCFCCLTSGHQAAKCLSRRRCAIESCKKIHNRLLHYVKLKSDVRTTNETENGNYESDSAIANEVSPISENPRNCHADNNQKNSILFQVIPVKLYNNKRMVEIYAFVDEGANVSMLDTQVASDLGLHGKEDVLDLQWLNNQGIRQKSERVTINISGAGKNESMFQMTNVYTSPNLELPRQTFIRSELAANSKNAHLSDLPIKDYREVQPKLIISLAHAFLTVPLEPPIAPEPTGPIAIRTRLGWIAYGPCNHPMKTKKHHAYCFRANEKDIMENIHEMMRSYFDIETFGTKPNTQLLLSDKDKKALSILKSTTKWNGERYESGLLWKSEPPQLPNSYQVALKRLEIVENRMERDPKFAVEYSEKINDYIKKGYAIKLNKEDTMIKSSNAFYLPHFSVKNPNKEGLRLVFDAAAKVQNTSLNDTLLSGPDINKPLLSILLKFREAPIGVTGDIKEMFHQVAVTKQDQNYQRFLWRNGERNKLPEIYVMQRLIFGASCSPTIAAYIKNMNAEKYMQVSPRAVEGIVNRHYVDDYVDSFSSEEEAIKVVKELIKIHKNGGFIIRKFISNNRNLREALGDAAENEKNVPFGKNPDRVLGLHWSTEDDTFMFVLKFAKISNEILRFKRKPTKREVLALTMSIFDPFGFLANFMIMAKVLLQIIWKTGISWDEVLPDNLYKKWKSWLEELSQVERLRIPRCYSSRLKHLNVDLHIFADASEEAVAAVAYWVIRSEENTEVIFVMGKTNCAPTRFHSIPKLELQAAVLATRLNETIIKNHTISVRKRYFWTDSHTVMLWINSDHRDYKQYVANRVSEILESTVVTEWRWCPGNHNPADEATRAKFPARYTTNNRWLSGPEFLHRNESEWPSCTAMNETDDHSHDEMKKRKYSFNTRQVKSIVPNINNFSNYTRLLRTMGWVIRYVHNLRQRVNKRSPQKGELSAEELSTAEVRLCRSAQRQGFEAEYNSLMSVQSVDKNSTLRTLNPFISKDGLIRANGRLVNSPFLPEETKYPIIIPKDHKLTRLIVSKFHRKLHHLNKETIMSEIRHKFWVPSLRRVLNIIEAGCMSCKIRKAKPLQPQMGALPPDRVTPFVRPFSYTGLDLFGPVEITVRRCREKRWVALFTCLSVRAVHLEIVADLSTDACLVGIRNFINRRGVPVQIRSDNGKNFVGIEKELRDVEDFLDHNVITAKLAPLGIKWIFNTPYNPNAGGAWERLVQSVKKVLRVMLVQHAPKFETLQSFLIEAENIVNARPLTHLPISMEEPEPLTPNHFLLGCANSTQTPAACPPLSVCLRKQWRIIKNMKNCFWKRWLAEYLPDLTRRAKWCLPTPPLKPDSLVLVIEPDLPRSQWHRGKVIKLYYGNDGVARSADVQTQTATIKRPVSRLAVLDVEPAEE